jgi:hypothetical protein
VAQALTPPMLLAAAVLCAAGFAKLRSPTAALRAFAVLGLPAKLALVRVLAVFELAIGVWCALAPSGPAAAVVAMLYAAFAVAAALLARRRSSCGCFGDDESPASAWQAVLSGLLAVVALAASLAAAHGLGWVLALPAAQAGALLIGIAGATYATVLAYTELPQAWSSWSAT